LKRCFFFILHSFWRIFEAHSIYKSKQIFEINGYSLVVLVLAAALEQAGWQYGHQLAADVVVEPAVDDGVADGRAHRDQVAHGRGDVDALG
jgi:hypothetical protein